MGKRSCIPFDFDLLMEITQLYIAKRGQVIRDLKIKCYQYFFCKMYYYRQTLYFILVLFCGFTLVC